MGLLINMDQMDQMDHMDHKEKKFIKKIVDGKLFCIPCNTKVESKHHFAAKHDSRIFKCEECGMEKVGNAKMNDHKKLHRSATCPKCKKTCSSKSSLWDHKNHCIENAKTKECDQCSYKARRGFTLKKHKERHHSDVGLAKAMAQLKPIKIIKKEEKAIKNEAVDTPIWIPDLKCPFCPFVTKRRRNLMKHVLKNCKGQQDKDVNVLFI